MVSTDDSLAFCTALLRLSTFTPAELAASAERRLSVAHEFLHSNTDLVVLRSARGHDPRRPLREYWSVTDNRTVLYRMVERLRQTSGVLPAMGELFDDVDRVLGDIRQSEEDLNHSNMDEGQHAVERRHLIGQRWGIEHALVDLEFRFTRAVRARRQRNIVAKDAAACAEHWAQQFASALSDWSVDAEKLAGSLLDSVLDSDSHGSDDPLADEIGRLCSYSTIDSAAVRRAILGLRAVRDNWNSPKAFGEALNVEFRYVLRQTYGPRLLDPLALVAAALAEAECSEALFEGWLTMQERGRDDHRSSLVPSVLARLAFETHLKAGKTWSSNPAASMCQYVLTTPLSPLGSLLVAAGSMFSEVPNLNHVFSVIARSHAQVQQTDPDEALASFSRTVWLALFMQTGRPEPLESIPSLPTLPGGDRLFEVLLDRRHGAVVHRLGRSRARARHRDEHYDLSPGSRIQPVLAQSFGDKDLHLGMSVKGEFERGRVAATTEQRWALRPAPNSSFLGLIELRGQGLAGFA